MKGPFKLGYFLKGAGFEDWFKSWGLGIRFLITILAILFLVVMIQRAFFRKDQTQTQSSRVVVYPFSFSTVSVVNAPQQQQKQEIKKRPWWLPIVFVEGYGFTETTGLNSNRTGLGGRAGARLEW